MTRSKLLVVLLSLGITFCVAQDKPAADKKMEKPAAKSGILQPQMKLGADAGTYEAPMGKLGEKPAQPWSATTIEAAVDKKANTGKIVTVTGEIVDFSCYLQVGKHGDAHRSCAQKCFSNGQPIGLLTKTGTLYTLMEEEHHPRRDGQTNLREAAGQHAGHVMEVTGTESAVAGQKAIFVTGFLKK